MKVTILGLSITSSWGNGHATNFRALVRALSERGDEVTFLERDMPWYARSRDLPRPPWGETRLYSSLEELRRLAPAIREADLVILGSFVPEGTLVAELVLGCAGGAVAFYDIDTPVTIGKLRAGDDEYLTAELAPRFDLYLSFTGGPAISILQDEFGVRLPEPFYCFVDADAYAPVDVERRWALNYLGTYSAGRQPALQELLMEPARRLGDEHFAVAGPMYPESVLWPANVERIEHLAPREHPDFYCAAAFTLNLTRPEMRELGHSPSVRLFEAAACGAPVISDAWPGLEEVFTPGEEIVVAASADHVVEALAAIGVPERRAIGAAARARVLNEHTAEHRVRTLHRLLASEPVA